MSALKAPRVKSSNTHSHAGNRSCQHNVIIVGSLNYGCNLAPMRLACMPPRLPICTFVHDMEYNHSFQSLSHSINRGQDLLLFRKPGQSPTQSPLLADVVTGCVVDTITYAQIACPINDLITGFRRWSDRQPNSQPSGILGMKLCPSLLVLVLYLVVKMFSTIYVMCASSVIIHVCLLDHLALESFIILI